MKSSACKNYDLIASIFDHDMALNMRFDDLGFYVDRVAGKSSVLEVGCGNGRIAIPVSKVCEEFVGVDLSLPMLTGFQQKIVESDYHNIQLALMDARCLAFKQEFDYVFFGFSGINYLTQPDDVILFIRSVKSILAINGRILLDVFVPKSIPNLPTDWTTDYVRQLPSGGKLKRSKQIIPQGSVNLINRCYEQYSATGVLERTINTESIICPYRPEEIMQMLVHSGFSICNEWWDYGSSSGEDDAQFFSVEACVS